MYVSMYVCMYVCRRLGGGANWEIGFGFVFVRAGEAKLCGRVTELSALVGVKSGKKSLGSCRRRRPGCPDGCLVVVPWLSREIVNELLLNLCYFCCF